jgi:SAM-dependent methyltransferase
VSDALVDNDSHLASANLICPICKTGRFLPFNGRENARCANCHAMERTRLLWLVLEKHGLFKPGLRVMHVAPELPLIKRFSELLSDRYYACDIDPARYSSKFTTVRPFDITCDLVKLPSCSFDLIIHNHVLEHVRCDIEPVMWEFERILAPGGRHYFSVPIRGDETRENLSDDLSPAERLKQFGQADHYRLFGRRSLPEMLDRVWGAQERHNVEPLELFAAAELEVAAVPEDAWSGISGHTIFHHIRPRLHRARVRDAAGSAPVKAGDSPNTSVQNAAAAFAGAGPKLILHIGMPKTGTTSIQNWLANNRAEALGAGLDYWSIAENHSGAAFMAFASQKRIDKGTMWFQRAAAAAKLDSEACRESFDRFLSGLGDRVGYLSAEALWTFGPDDVRNLAAYLRQRQAQVLILCWVRPPAEFLKTNTQQLCRSTLAIGDFGVRFHRKIPIEFRRLEAWIEQFGRDRVVVQQYGADVVAQLRDWLCALGIKITASNKPERVLNSSISLTAAKALLALNESTRDESPERSKRLRGMLLDIAGPEFQIPDSVLQHMRPIFEKEAAYLADTLSIDRNWLLPEAGGIDDALFFHWDYAEVIDLLKAVADALAKPEDKKEKPGNTA